MSVENGGPVPGVDAEVEELYRAVRGDHGFTVEAAAHAHQVTPRDYLARIDGLLQVGAVRLVDGVLHVRPPRQAIGLLLEAQADVVVEQARRLARLSTEVRHLDDRPDAAPGESAHLDADVVQGPVPIDLLLSWIRDGTGELMFLRPDQWRLPTEPAVAAAFQHALGQGRRARGLYPVRALHQARSTLTDRAAAGEEIRLLPEVPSRLAIVGDSRALLPPYPGITNERSLVVREPGLVAHLRLYFEELWDQAVALPLFESQDVRGDARRLLLAELAEGARDEQIARTLGIGLRTVRRRIASLMIELGAETRFQAGVEAVRRGWL